MSAVIISCGSQFAYSAQVKGLYQAKVEVADQSESQRHEALIQALKFVLVKVSGSRRVLANTALMDAISKPEQWVQQFSYHRRKETLDVQSTSNVTPDLAEHPLSQEKLLQIAANKEVTNLYHLKVLFSRTGVNKLLQQYQEPVWGANRPAVLIWAAVSELGVRKLQAAGQEPWNSLLLDAAAERGLPLFLPTMDLQDEANMNSSDVWGLFMEPVITASSRYGADVVVAMKAYSYTGVGWKGSWSLSGSGVQLSGELVADSPDGVARQLVDSVADALADRFALKEVNVNNADLRIHVMGIDNLDNYIDLESYLTSLDIVEHVTPVIVQAGEVYLNLLLRGNVDQLQQYLDLDHFLIQEQAAMGDTQDSFQFNYRWEPKREFNPAMQP